MKLARLVALSKIILFGHVLNWFWRDRETRRAVRSDVLARVIPCYFMRYLPAAAAVPERPVEKNDKNEKIFTIWLQGENNAPPLVQACFRSVRKNCPQELVVLDEKTLRDYITLPDIIWQKRAKGQIKNAHFADICRVELLYEHGGIWLDSTGFATAHSRLDYKRRFLCIYGRSTRRQSVQLHAELFYTCATRCIFIRCVACNDS